DTNIEVDEKSEEKSEEDEQSLGDPPSPSQSISLEHHSKVIESIVTNLKREDENQEAVTKMIEEKDRMIADIKEQASRLEDENEALYKKVKAKEMAVDFKQKLIEAEERRSGKKLSQSESPSEKIES